MKSHTFVVCAYKESEYLEECIISLLNQTMQSEIKIATSTPNDYIQSLAEKYKLEVLVNYGETGIAGDWNFALGCADTKYVTIAHQDDIYLEDYTATVVDAMDRQKKPIIAFTDYCEIRGERKVTDIKLLKIKRIMLFPLRSRILQRVKWVRRLSLSIGSAICCPSVCYCMEQMPEPVFLKHFRASIDWQTWERLSRIKGSFVFCPDVLMGHRIHEQSETSAAIKDHVRTCEDYEMFCKFWPAPIAKFLSKRYAKSEDSNNIER